MKIRGLPLRLSIGAFALLAIDLSAEVRYTGVNLSGAEFGATVLPGTYNVNYTYPNQTEVDYFRSKGLNIFRLCFRWERLQQTTNANFNSTELNRLHSFVSTTTAKGQGRPETARSAGHRPLDFGPFARHRLAQRA